MKYLSIIILSLLPFNQLFAQTNFERGFKTGFKQGYCHDKSYGCIEPVAPIAPIPKINENSSSYNDGYNRGFELGLEAQRSDSNTNNDIDNGRYKTSSPEFSDHTYKPDLNLQVLLANTKIKNDELYKKILFLVKEKVKEFRDNIDDVYYKNRFQGELSVLESISYENTTDNHKAIIKRVESVMALLDEYNSKVDSKNIESSVSSSKYDLKGNSSVNTSKINYKNIYNKSLEDFKNKNYENALGRLNILEEKIDQKVINDKVLIFEAYALLANIYYATEKHIKVISFSTKAINNSTDDNFIKLFGLYFIRSMAKSNVGDYYGSNLDLDYMIKNHDKLNINSTGLSNLYNNKGYNLIKQKKYKEAIGYIDKALVLDNNLGYVWSSKGELEYHLGNYSKAIDALTTSIVLDPIGISYYFKGLSEIEMGDVITGCKDLSKAGEMGYSDAYVVIKEKCN